MGALRTCLFAILLAVALGGCGGKSEQEGGLDEEARAACTGSALDTDPRLPARFPKLAEVTYTVEETRGPTEVVEGYYEGDVQSAHDDFKRELTDADFAVLFDELEERDSEISWKGAGRSGQVALRAECGESGKTLVHITNRPE
jgi:hypothetical protein